jgi:ADP-ribose pyrophosphatase YjhB (NUDIX family)
VVPGGRREPDEAQLAALERELLEETGWTVREPRLLGLLRIRFLNERPDAAPFYPEFAQQVFVGVAAEHRPDACAGEEYEVECAFRPVPEALASTLAPGNEALLRAATAVRIRPLVEADQLGRLVCLEPRSGRQRAVRIDGQAPQSRVPKSNSGRPDRPEHVTDEHGSLGPDREAPDPRPQRTDDRLFATHPG